MMKPLRTHSAGVLILVATLFAPSLAAQQGLQSDHLKRPDSADPVDYALDFDGSGDRVTVPYSPSFPTEVFTIAAWIQLTPPPSRAAIIARGEDDNSWNLSWQLYVQNNGELQIMLEDANETNYCYPTNGCVPQGSCVSGNLFVADGAWHHVAATRESNGNLLMYIDGVLIGSCAGTGVPSSNNFQDLTIGCTHGTIGPPPGGVEPPIWFFPGLINDVAMWSRVLSDVEIASLHADGIDFASVGLVGAWSMDEGTGQIVSDASPAGNHGFRGAAPGRDSADPEWLEL